MILHGNKRGGAKQLGLHLLKDENDHVDVHEIRGFVANDVVSALNEAHAISKGTRARQFLFSMSLNPPPSANVPTQEFVKTVDRAEEALGLSGQPRVVVFHEKAGVDGVQRRHCHAVWSRIDTQQMKAIDMPYTKMKLQDLSKQLYLENGWDMPKGFINKEQASKHNFTLAQWQQAKRNLKDPRQIKAAMQDSFATSHDQESFKAALKDKGYVLAKGDRRGVVALDQQCEIYSVPKWTSLRTKRIKEKVNNPSALPSVDEAKNQIAREMQQQLQVLKEQQAKQLAERMNVIHQKRRALAQQQTEQRNALKETQAKRWAEEVQKRQSQYNKGIRGLIDHFTGHHQRLKQQNEMEMLSAYHRDQKERDQLVFSQMQERQNLTRRKEQLKAFKQEKQQTLSNDIEQFKEVVQSKKAEARPKSQLRNTAQNQPRVDDFRQLMLNRQSNFNREK